GEARPPVRLLHAWDDHGRRRSPGPHEQPHRRRDSPRHRGQHLPLHGLPQHRRRDPRGRRHDGRRRDRADRRDPGLTAEPERSTAMATDVQDVLGAPVKRVEDPRFITGKGRYLDDIHLAGTTHMAILRSPYAHAMIRSIDTSAAKTKPGVIAVFTGADIPWN